VTVPLSKDAPIPRSTAPACPAAARTITSTLRPEGEQTIMSAHAPAPVHRRSEPGDSSAATLPAGADYWYNPAQDSLPSSVRTGAPGGRAAPRPTGCLPPGTGPEDATVAVSAERGRMPAANQVTLRSRLHRSQARRQADRSP
jgi:hypothetical protein